MDERVQDLAIQWYEWLEQQLLDIMAYLPPAPQNLNTFSPRLASLIVESCGLLDSILRQVTPDPISIGRKTKRRKDLDITDYEKLYASKHDLPNLKSILLISPPEYRTPFSSWVGGYKSPPWWRIHTELKHDRLANVQKATLDVAIESLCALHQVIASVPELGRMAFRRGWIPGNKPSPEIVIEILEGKQGYVPLLVERKLFVVAKGREKFPAKIEDFSPAAFNTSEKVIDFFGRW